jgi:hypothetical protein
MRNLDEVHNSELNPAFKAAADNFVHFVTKNAKSKHINGTSLNGRAFAKMFEHFLASVNTNSISIISTFCMVANDQNKKATEIGIQTFEEVFAKVKFPVSSSKFANLAKSALESGTKAFLDSTIDIKANEDFKENLSATLDKMIEKKKEENDKSSTEKCHQLLEELFRSIDKKMTEGKYLLDGGYELVKKDIVVLKLDYQTRCAGDEDIGPSQLDALGEFEKAKVIKRTFQNNL